MGAYCRGCGVNHDEDDDRLCARCVENQRRELAPGDTVHHSLKTKEHDDWTGIVLCIETHAETGTQTGRVGVRWISPTGAPNDGWNWHWPFELVLAKAALGGGGATPST